MYASAKKVTKKVTKKLSNRTVVDDIFNLKKKLGDLRKKKKLGHLRKKSSPS